MKIKAILLKFMFFCILSSFMCSFFNSKYSYGAPSDQGIIKDPKQFEIFADNFMREAMSRYNVPGAALSVVKDGKLLYKKGYGYADIEKKILVDPDKTIFCAGSISKLFTATAALQLVEQGKMDLNEDVNNYLKNFKIKTGSFKPVTLANLLTHTAGFDELAIGVALDYEDEVSILEDYLKLHMPPVIREPGTIIQHSNHGMALAGYLVEKLSGISFEKYIEQKIFSPLNMKNSSFFLNKDSQSNMALCYVYIDNMYARLKNFNINIPPSGSLVTTADDMSRFIIAHLQKGKFSDKRILNEDTALKMQKQQFTNHKIMNGVTYGFFESIRNGIRVLEHEGIISSYQSMVSLLPEENAGFFITTNSSGGRELINNFADEFYKLFKTQKNSTQVLSASAELKSNQKEYDGIYTLTKRPKKNIMKIASILSKNENIIIKSDENGRMILKKSDGENEIIKIDEGLFQNTKDGSLIAFKKDKEGNIYLIPGSSPQRAYERLKWYENRILHIIILSICILLFLSGCVLWIILMLSKRKLSKKGRSSKAMKLLFIECFINIIFLIGFMLYFVNNNTLAVTNYLVFLLCLPFISVAVNIFMMLHSLSAWRKNYWKNKGRLYYTTVTAASLIFIILLNFYNLIGFKF